MSEEGQLLQLHIEEDRLAFAEIRTSLKDLHGKVDDLVQTCHAQNVSLARTQTEVRLKSKWLNSIMGFVAGLAASVVVALIS